MVNRQARLFENLWAQVLSKESNCHCSEDAEEQPHRRDHPHGCSGERGRDVDEENEDCGYPKEDADIFLCPASFQEIDLIPRREIVVGKNYVVRLRIQHTHAAVTRVHKPIAIGPEIVKTHEMLCKCVVSVGQMCVGCHRCS